MPLERLEFADRGQRRPRRQRARPDRLPQSAGHLLPADRPGSRVRPQIRHVPVLGKRPAVARQVAALLQPRIHHVQHRPAHLADLQMAQCGFDRLPDVPLVSLPGGQVPLGERGVLVQQLSHGSAGLGLPAGLRLLEELPELDLRANLGLAGLPEPDLTAGQRVLPGLHLDAEGPAGQLLYVTRWRDGHGTTVQRRTTFGPRIGPRPNHRDP